MKSRVLGSATLKRLLGAACLVFSVVTCGGDDEKQASGGKGGEDEAGRGGSSGSGGVGAAGGEDGQGGAGGEPSELSGTVAGYLEGATVFLDLDEDFSRDANEPSATTDSEGRFLLELTGDVDPASFPVVALVPGTAIDSYTGEQVPRAFVLAAPAGANTFVSPLSSLVAGFLGRYPSSSLGEAETAIRSRLAVSAEVSLFADYVADAASTASTAGESQKLLRVARVAARSFGIDMQAIDAITTATVEPMDAFQLVTHNVELQLPSLAEAVAESDSDEDQLRTLAAFLKHVDAASLEERLDKSRRATRVDLYDTFAGEGAHIPFPGSNGWVFAYARVRPTPEDREAFSLPQENYTYDDDTSTYVPESVQFFGGYALTADGWVLRTAANATPTFSSNADGSAGVASDVVRSTQRWSSNAVDLSGRLIRAYARGIDVTDRDSRFPEGAIGHRIAVHTSLDEYDADEEDGRNPDLYALTNLDDVEATYGPDGVFLKTLSMLNIKLLSDGVVGFSSGRDDQSLPLVGSWGRRTVEGVELIEIMIPVAYKLEYDFLEATKDLFIAVIDGHARTGEVTRAGVMDSQDIYFLNQTAMDAVLAAAVAQDDGTLVSGQVVADGYLGGATVFLDVNDNGLFDKGEPSDTTGPTGVYTLFWSERDFEAHSLGALVPATATVSLPGQSQTFSVTQPFSLRAAPGETFITPYTTMAWYLVESGTVTTYDDALAELSTILGATGPLTDYVSAADALQTKIRLVAGMVAEKFKQVRARMLATSTGTTAVAMNPDDIGIYRSIVGATYESLPSTVMSVEMLLASAMQPGTLDDYVDRDIWAEIGERLLRIYLQAFVDVAEDLVDSMVAYAVAELVGDAFTDVPYIGWLLGPSVECTIKQANGIVCD